MNDSFRPKSKFAKFMEGNGFYLALAVCIIGAGTAAWIAVDRTNTNVTQPAPSASQHATPAPSYGFPDLEKAQETEKNQPDVVIPPPAENIPQKEEKPVDAQPAQPVPQDTATAKAVEPSSFVMPVSGEVFGAYSNGELVKNDTLREWRTHDGIDIKASMGDSVKAVCDGKVSAVRDDPLMGMTVEILHHDDITSIYSGLAKDVSVKEGAKVKVGQSIGTVGEIPAEISSDAHLHFAMKIGGKWVDPLKTMDML